MKKHYLLISLILLFVSFSYSQKQANMWYFGDNAGINFNSGAPVSFSGSAMRILEGCASIADTAGNPLFYTNGLNVWNKNNQQMPNGYGLLGDDNAAQSAIIVPAPGSYNKYYIFTAPTNGNLSMHYSVVDMTLQGGLGDITTKNFTLFSNSTEKVTAVYHANGHDIWVIGHQFQSNNFYAYLVTTAGVSTTPVITAVGSVNTGSLGFAGYMKASHHGHKIAYAVTVGMNIVETFDFDNNTGIPSNPITFTNVDEAYGLEFSPDDSKLYSTEENPEILVQWDLNAGNPAAVIASRQDVYTGTGGIHYAALQLAPDGKIYMSKLFGSSNILGAITKPNLAGTACNYVEAAFTVTSGTTQYGLPNFFQSYFSDSINITAPPVSLFQSPDTAICAGSCVTFSNLSSNASTYQWSFPGGNRLTDTALAPLAVCYSNPGKYNVQLIALKGNTSDTLVLSNYITVNSLPVTGTIQAMPDTLCSGDTSQLSTTGSSGNIQWQLSVTGNSFSDITGANSTAYNTPPLLQTTGYRLIATNGNCTDTSAALPVIVNPNPSPPILSTNDSLICSSDSTLITTSGSYSSYFWNNRDTRSYTYADQGGGYWVTVTDANGCTAVSSHQNISVYPVPSVSIVVQGDTLSSFNAVSYQWYKDGAIISGATLPVYVISGPGDYAVQVTDTNGCKALSNSTYVTITGIIQPGETGALNIYPNPFTNSISIKLKDASAGIESLMMYDELGRIVMSRKFDTMPAQLSELDVSVLAKGVYYIKIKTKNWVFVQPVVKE